MPVTKEWRDNHKDQIREARKKWYANNREKAKKAVRDRQIELKEWFHDLKNKMSCSICSEEETCCLDFHHKDPSKKEGLIGVIVNNGWSKERILKEISKCQVVCSNCHRKIHAGLI